MFTAVLISWPDAPREGLVQTLCESVEATVGPGDKLKALVQPWELQQQAMGRKWDLCPRSLRLQVKVAARASRGFT
jgi:hypothetical protein